MKIPEKLYSTNMSGFSSEVLREILALKNDKVAFLAALKKLRKNTELKIFSSVKELAELLDICDSILESNNDQNLATVLDENVASQILKFYESAVDNPLFAQLFHSTDRVLFLLQHSDSFKTLQLSVRVAQTILRFSDELLSARAFDHSVIQEFKSKLLSYVNLAFSHLNSIFPKSGSFKLPLAAVYYEDSNIDKILQNASIIQTSRKDSTVRKGSLQGKILRGHYDGQLQDDIVNSQNLTNNLEEGDKDEDSVFLTKEMLLKISKQKIINFVGKKITNLKSDGENDLAENQINCDKADKLQTLDTSALGLEGRSSYVVAKEIAEKYQLKQDGEEGENVDSFEFSKIRIALMYIKHRDDEIQRAHMINFFINSFKIYVKNKTAVQLKDFKPENLVEELINILKLKSTPKIHSKIVRLIRFYARNQAVEYGEMLLSALRQVCLLDPSCGLEKTSQNKENTIGDEPVAEDIHVEAAIEDDEFVIPAETAQDIEFQKQLIGLLGDKSDFPIVNNISALAAPFLINISNSLIRAANSPAPLKLVFSLEIITKVQIVLTSLMKHNEINREHNIFEKHLLPQYLILLSLPSHDLLPLQLAGRKEEKEKTPKIHEIPITKESHFEIVQLWKEITIDELYSKINVAISGINEIFRSQQQNQRGNQTISRKIIATNFFDIFYDCLKKYHHPELFYSSLAFVYRIVNEQPQLMTQFITKGLVDILLETLIKNSLPKDTMNIKHSLQFITALCITDKGKELAIKSGYLNKVFNAFTQKEYIQCFSVGGNNSSSQPETVMSPLTMIAEVIARNTRSFDQGNLRNDSTPRLIELLSQTMITLTEKKMKYLECLEKDSFEEQEFTSGECRELFTMLDNFCRFFVAICSREGFFLRNSDKYEIFESFLILVRFPILDAGNDISKKGLIHYAVQLREQLKEQSVEKAFNLLKKELSLIETLIGVPLDESTDFSSVFLDSLPFHSKEIDLYKTIQHPSKHALIKPLQLATSLLFINGLVHIIITSIQQSTYTKINKVTFLNTLTLLQRLYVIIGSSNKEEMSWLRRHLAGDSANKEKECLDQLQYWRNSMSSGVLSSTLRSLFRVLLVSSRSYVVEVQRQAVFSSGIEKIIQSIPREIVFNKVKNVGTKKEIKDAVEQKEDNIDNKEELESESWMEQFSRISLVDQIFGHISLFLGIAMEDGKKVEGENSIGISCFGLLRQAKVFPILIESIKTSMKLLVDSSESKKKQTDQSIQDKLLGSALKGLADKLAYLVDQIFVRTINISQPYYVQGEKQKEVQINTLVSGINFYLIQQFEDILKNNLVKLQKQPEFISLVEILLQKTQTTFELDTKATPLTVDLDRKIKEKAKAEEELRKIKFETDVQMIVDMGFSRRRAITALGRYKDINQAVEYLASQQFVYEPNEREEEEQQPRQSNRLGGEQAGQDRPNVFHQGRRSVDLGELMPSFNQEEVEVKNLDDEQIIKNKSEEAVKEKIIDFKYNISTLIFNQILNFNQTLPFVIDLMIKPSDNNVSQNKGLTNNLVFPQLASDGSKFYVTPDEIACLLLWNIRSLAGTLTENKFNLKISPKILSSEFKPKIIFDLSLENTNTQSPGQVTLQRISLLSKALFVLTKFTISIKNKIILKKSVSAEILNFCKEVADKIIKDQKLFEQEDSNEKPIISEYFKQCLIIADCIVQFSDLSNNQISKKDKKRTANINKSKNDNNINKTDQSVSSFQGANNSSKDDSMISKNSQISKKHDVSHQLISLIQTITEITLNQQKNTNNQSWALNSECVDGILKILSNVMVQNNKFNSVIAESSVVNNILNLQLSSLSAILSSLTNFYSAALMDKQSQLVFIEAKIKSFFLFFKHKNALQDKKEENTNTAASSAANANQILPQDNTNPASSSGVDQNKPNSQNITETPTTSVVPSTTVPSNTSPTVPNQVLSQEEPSNVQKPIRVPLEAFLNRFAQISQSPLFSEVFGRICKTKKDNGKEWIELNRDTDVHRVLLPVSLSSSANSSVQSKKISTANISVNSSGLSGSQICSTYKLDFAANYIPKQPASTLINQLLEAFIGKVVQRIANNSKETEKQPGENQSESEQQQQQKQTTLEIDEGILFHLIHFIVKKYPLFVPYICKFRVYKTIAKILKSETAINQLLSLPQVPSEQQQPQQPLKQATFLQFLSRVVMRHFQHFARDLLLELCMDSFVMRSPRESFASEVRKSIISDTQTYFQAHCLQLSTAPENLLSLVTCGQIICLLLNLKQFKNQIGTTSIKSASGTSSSNSSSKQFLDLFSEALGSFKISSYFQFENFLPFITQPLAIIHRYALSNVMKNRKSIINGTFNGNNTPISETNYLYQSHSAQFVPMKYAITQLQTQFVQAWRKILSLQKHFEENSNNNSQAQALLLQQQLEQEMQLQQEQEELHQNQDEQGDWTLAEEENGELEIPFDMQQFQQDEEGEIYEDLQGQEDEEGDEEHGEEEEEEEEGEGEEEEEELQEDDEEVFPQGELGARGAAGGLSEGNQTSLLENSLSQEPNSMNVGYHYLAESGMGEGYEEGFASEEGNSEIEVQANGLNSEDNSISISNNNNLNLSNNTATNQNNTNLNIQQIRQAEIFEDDDEDDLEDDDDEDHEIPEESKDNQISEAPIAGGFLLPNDGISVGLGNQPIKDLKKYLKFDEKSFFCQQISIQQLQESERVLMRGKMLGGAQSGELKSVYETLAHLEKHSQDYFNIPTKNWNSLGYITQPSTWFNSFRQANPSNLGTEQNQSSLLSPQNLLLEILSRRDTSEGQLRQLLRQLEQNVPSFLQPDFGDNQRLFGNRYQNSSEANNNNNQPDQEGAHSRNHYYIPFRDRTNQLQNPSSQAAQEQEMLQRLEESQRTRSQMMNRFRDLLLSDAVEEQNFNRQLVERQVSNQEEDNEGEDDDDNDDDDQQQDHGLQHQFDDQQEEDEEPHDNHEIQDGLPEHRQQQQQQHELPNIQTNIWENILTGNSLLASNNTMPGAMGVAGEQQNQQQQTTTSTAEQQAQIQEILRQFSESTQHQQITGEQSTAATIVNQGQGQEQIHVQVENQVTQVQVNNGGNVIPSQSTHNVDQLNEQERIEMEQAMELAQIEFDRMNQEFEEEEQDQLRLQQEIQQQLQQEQLQQIQQLQQPQQQLQQEQPSQTAQTQQLEVQQSIQSQPDPVQPIPSDSNPVPPVEESDFLQRSLALLQQFDLDLGFFERNELDPLYFDELPEDIKMEIILNYLPLEQERAEALRQSARNAPAPSASQQQQANQPQQQQQQQNPIVPEQQQAQNQPNQPSQPSQDPQGGNPRVPDNAASDETYTSTFLASLPPHLRDEILQTASPEVLGEIPVEMRQHAQMLQQQGVEIHNQQAEVQQLQKREQKKLLEQQLKKQELKQKILKVAEKRQQMLQNNALRAELGLIADERVLQKLIELLYVDGDSFTQFPYQLLASLFDNPYAEYKMFDAMMFILRSPGIAMIHKNAAGKGKYQEIINEVEEEKTEGLLGTETNSTTGNDTQLQKEQEKVLFPPIDMIDRPIEGNEKTNKNTIQLKKKTQKEIYIAVAQKILFLLCNASQKNLLSVIDASKQGCQIVGLAAVEQLKDSLNRDINKKPKRMIFQDLAQLLTSEAVFENPILLELLITLLHNMAKKHYFNFEESITSSVVNQQSQSSISVKSLCQVLSSDSLSKRSLKKISEIMNYMCINPRNLADFIAELTSIIMLFAEDINLVLDKYVPLLRVKSNDARILKSIQEHVHGINKFQKMFTIVKELFEKSQQVKEKEMTEEIVEEKKEDVNKKEDDITRKSEQQQQNEQLGRIREKIQEEFTHLVQDRQLQRLWIHLAELFSLIGEHNNQAHSFSVIQTFQPLLESFLIIQFNLNGASNQTASTTGSSNNITQPPQLPKLTHAKSSISQQPSQHQEELLVSHLSFKEVRERTMSSQQLFFFVCEKSKNIINSLIRSKLLENIRRQQEGDHRQVHHAYTSILQEPVGVVFKYIPRIIEFENKKTFFQMEIRNIKARAANSAGQINCRIRRKEVLVDSFYSINQLKPDQLKGRLRIQFEGEEGIDAGGLTREWFLILSKEIFNPNYCLFLPSQSGNTFQPNPNSYINNQDKQYFKFVGRIVGKAIFDGHMLEAYFTRSFYKHILGQEITYHDIQDQDNEFYKNMKWIVENDVTPLDLTFSYETNQFGKLEEIEMKPGGKNIPVTEENKLEYVHLICHMKMTKRIENQIRFFLEGFHDIIPSDIISVFDSHELELMISGLPDIDLADLKANTEYHNYRPTDPIIMWFWEILGSYDSTQKAAFLQFFTGTSKVPLEGFSQLRGIQGIQKFQIHKAYSKDKLPTTHTCFNQLDLPEYDSKETLAEKLTYAILEGKEGFGFG